MGCEDSMTDQRFNDIIKLLELKWETASFSNR